MLAEPLETAAASVNQKQPGTVKTEDLVSTHVGNAYVQFIIHPTNPIQSLSKAQLAGLFSGTIKNWSELGGTNLPVLLIGEPTSSPHRIIADALATLLFVGPSCCTEHQPNGGDRGPSPGRPELYHNRPRPP